MSRSRVHPQKAAAAVAAVREGTMSYRRAAETYSVSVASIQKRLKDGVPMDSKTSRNTVLTREEEDTLADALLWAAYHHLALGRSALVDAVRTICLEGRAIPWDPEKDPGQSWAEDFFKRHLE